MDDRILIDRLRFVLCVFIVFMMVGRSHADVVWVPGSSTYDGKTFVSLQAGVGAPAFGFPSASNPAGMVIAASGIYAFGFANAIPESSGPTLAQTDLSASPLKAGTELVLRFSKASTEHISFIAMVADASDLSNIGFKLISDIEFEVRAKIVDPVLSETNNPDNLSAAFGLIVQTTPSLDEAFNVRGTVFVTDMHWLDLEPPAFDELPQNTDDVQGMAAGLAAQGISSVLNEGAANFTAFMPEDFFEFARANGVEVTGADCLGYRAFVDLTGSEDGFFKLNDPSDQPVLDENFDINGDGQADGMWRFRITNSTWSRQVLSFGKIESATQAKVGDFDGNGEVAFSDFLMFATHFGAKSGEEKFDNLYDLNQDGEIGFGDFITFAGQFGK